MHIGNILVFELNHILYCPVAVEDIHSAYLQERHRQIQTRPFPYYLAQ